MSDPRRPGAGDAIAHRHAARMALTVGTGIVSVFGNASLYFRVCAATLMFADCR